MKSFKSKFSNLDILAKKEFVSLKAEVNLLTEGKNQLGFFIFRTGGNAFEEVIEIVKESTVSIE